MQNGVDALPSGVATASMTDALKAVMMLSDIGHASASFAVHRKWSERVRDEFFKCVHVSMQTPACLAPAVCATLTLSRRTRRRA